jgi:hypothetical protein
MILPDHRILKQLRLITGFDHTVPDHKNEVPRGKHLGMGSGLPINEKDCKKDLTTLNFA